MFSPVCPCVAPAAMTEYQLRTRLNYKAAVDSIAPPPVPDEFEGMCDIRIDCKHISHPTSTYQIQRYQNRCVLVLLFFQLNWPANRKLSLGQ